jgi:hypothetical protein
MIAQNKVSPLSIIKFIDEFRKKIKLEIETNQYVKRTLILAEFSSNKMVIKHGKYMIPNILEP